MAGRALHLHGSPSSVGRYYLQSVLLHEGGHGLDVVWMRAELFRKLFRSEALPQLRRGFHKIFEIWKRRPVLPPPQRDGYLEALFVIHLPDQLRLA